jgi:histidine kinase/DNA gyrase B/HSP90-like ATPase
MPTRGRSLPTGATALAESRGYSEDMKNSRSALGFSVMTIVPLLQLGTEYLGTGDRGRALSKLAATLLGLPILLWGSSRGLRWATGRPSGPLWLLAGGMLSAGALYAVLLDGMHLASFSIAFLRPGTGIAGLTTEDPRAARRLLASLGDLLRDSLRDQGDMQTLGDQIDWLKHYGQILEERHAGRLEFHWDVGAGTRGALLPRLLLQPLIENAVKHGALARKDGGRIAIRAEVVGAPRKKLVCTVEDNGLGMPDGKARPGAFGLHSVQRRLALQYAKGASFRLESSAAGTRSIVEIPLEETNS